MDGFVEGSAPEFITEEEIESLARQVVEESLMPLDAEIMLGSTQLKIRYLDQRETIEAMKSTEGLDLLTRELAMQREFLSRAICEVNGKPSKPLVVRRFLNSLPPSAVERVYQEFTLLRKVQATALEKVYSTVKK